MDPKLPEEPEGTILMSVKIERYHYKLRVKNKLNKASSGMALFIFIFAGLYY